MSFQPNTTILLASTDNIRCQDPGLDLKQYSTLSTYLVANTQKFQHLRYSQYSDSPLIHVYAGYY